MAFQNLKNKTSITGAFGSPHFVYANVTTVSPYTLETFYTGPLLADSNYSSEPNTTTVEIEDGENITLSSTKTTTFSLTVAQRDAKTQNWIDFEIDGKTISLIKCEHQVAIDGVYTALWYPLASPTGSTSKNAKGVEREVPFNALVVDTLVTADTSALTSNVTSFPFDMPALITCPAGQSFVRILVSA